MNYKAKRSIILLFTISIISITTAAKADEFKSCTDFYSNTPAGTIGYSRSPIRKWDISELKHSGTQLASPQQRTYFTYNHRATEKRDKTFLAVFSIAYVRAEDDFKNLYVYRNANWTRSDPKYKRTPSLRHLLKKPTEKPYSDAGLCRTLLETYKEPTYQKVDGLLSASGSSRPNVLLDGSPFESDDDTFDAVEILQSRTMRELEACEASSHTCKCRIYYLAFKPLEGSCSTAPVDWNISVPDTEKLVLLPYSPHTPDMDSRLEINFEQE